MNNLKELRISKRLTQAELAQMIGIGQNTYSYWENDKVKIDNLSLSKLSKLFGVSIDYILGNEQKNKPFVEAKSYSKEATDLLDRIDRLSPANRDKLSELIDLYLSSQGKKQ
nr:helix-turn-helix transcriptional regulator [uncultured Caproiciproducens sp.]